MTEMMPTWICRLDRRNHDQPITSEAEAIASAELGVNIDNKQPYWILLAIAPKAWPAELPRFMEILDPEQDYGPSFGKVTHDTILANLPGQVIAFTDGTGRQIANFAKDHRRYLPWFQFKAGGWEIPGGVCWVASHFEDNNRHISHVIEDRGKRLAVRTITIIADRIDDQVLNVRYLGISEIKYFNRQKIGWDFPLKVDDLDVTDRYCHQLNVATLFREKINPHLRQAMVHGKDDPLLTEPPVRFSRGDGALLRKLVAAAISLADIHVEPDAAEKAGIGPSKVTVRTGVRFSREESQPGVVAFLPQRRLREGRLEHFIQHYILDMIRPMGHCLERDPFGNGGHLLSDYFIVPVKYEFPVHEPTGHEAATAYRTLRDWLTSLRQVGPKNVDHALKFLRFPD